MKESKVALVRRLLGEARIPDLTEVRRREGPLGTVKRKFLIQQAKLLAGQYSLGEHLDALVYAAGCEALTGLDLDQLEYVVAELGRLGCAADVAADHPGGPPAR